MGKRLHGKYQSQLNSSDLEVRPTFRKPSIESAKLIHSGLEEAENRISQKNPTLLDQVSFEIKNFNSIAFLNSRHV